MNQNQTELNCIKSYLDRRLFNNDVNIVKMIMDYALEECDICSTKQLDLYEDDCLDCYDSDCHVCPDNDFNHVSVCDECHKNICDSCGDVFCPLNEDKHTCSDEECNKENKRVFCDGCYPENLMYCYECEGRYCCRDVYVMGINAEGGDNYMCGECIAECMINSRISASYDK